jgi:hypothetical protein
MTGPHAAEIRGRDCNAEPTAAAAITAAAKATDPTRAEPTTACRYRGLLIQMRKTMHRVLYCSICGTEHRAGMMKLTAGGCNCSTSRLWQLVLFASVVRSNLQQNNQH